MPPVHPRPAHNSDGPQAISGRTGAIATEVAHRRRPRRSRMAAQVPVESGTQHHGHEPKRRAPVSESSHANVLVLRQRASETRALLRSFVAAASSLHSGGSASAHRQRNGHGSELVLKYRSEEHTSELQSLR